MKNNNYIISVSIVVFFVLAIYYIGLHNMDSIYNYFCNDDPLSSSNKGTFGDSTAVINTLFSSLAFGGVVLTLYWQLIDSKKQRIESHRLQFENVFFNMTNTFEQIVSGLIVEGSPAFSVGKVYAEASRQATPTYKGRDVFKYLYNRTVASEQGKTKINMHEAIEMGGIQSYELSLNGELDHYYRYFYRILKFIDDSKLINDDVKYRYAGILRAHISYYEMILIYYNGLSKYGREKLKPLLEKYSMLDNIDRARLHEQRLKAELKDGYYADRAFHREDNFLPVVSFYDLIAKMLFAISFAYVFKSLCSTFWLNVVVADILSPIPWDDPSVQLLVLLLLIWMARSVIVDYKARTAYYINACLEAKIGHRKALGMLLLNSKTICLLLFFAIVSSGFASWYSCFFVSYRTLLFAALSSEVIYGAYLGVIVLNDYRKQTNGKHTVKAVLNVWNKICAFCTVVMNKSD